MFATYSKLTKFPATLYTIFILPRAAQVMSYVPTEHFIIKTGIFCCSFSFFKLLMVSFIFHSAKVIVYSERDSGSLPSTRRCSPSSEYMWQQHLCPVMQTYTSLSHDTGTPMLTNISFHHFVFVLELLLSNIKT